MTGKPVAAASVFDPMLPNKLASGQLPGPHSRLSESDSERSAPFKFEFIARLSLFVDYYAV